MPPASRPSRRRATASWGRRRRATATGPATGTGGRSGARALAAATLALGLLLSSALTACDGSSDTATEEPIRLSIFWWGGDKRAELTERALKLYSSRHPEVTFQVTWQGNTGYYERLSSQAAGGNPPDLFQIDDNYLTEYAEREIVLDLSDYVRSERLDLTGLPPAWPSTARSPAGRWPSPRPRTRPD